MACRRCARCAPKRRIYPRLVAAHDAQERVQVLQACGGHAQVLLGGAAHPGCAGAGSVGTPPATGLKRHPPRPPAACSTSAAERSSADSGWSAVCRHAAAAQPSSNNPAAKLAEWPSSHRACRWGCDEQHRGMRRAPQANSPRQAARQARQAGRWWAQRGHGVGAAAGGTTCTLARPTGPVIMHAWYTAAHPHCGWGKRGRGQTRQLLVIQQCRWRGVPGIACPRQPFRALAHRAHLRQQVPSRRERGLLLQASRGRGCSQPGLGGVEQGVGQAACHSPIVPEPATTAQGGRLCLHQHCFLQAYKFETHKHLLPAPECCQSGTLLPRLRQLMVQPLAPHWRQARRLGNAGRQLHRRAARAAPAGVGRVALCSEQAAGVHVGQAAGAAAGALQQRIIRNLVLPANAAVGRLRCIGGRGRKGAAAASQALALCSAMQGREQGVSMRGSIAAPGWVARGQQGKHGLGFAPCQHVRAMPARTSPTVGTQRPARQAATAPKRAARKAGHPAPTPPPPLPPPGRI